MVWDEVLLFVHFVHGGGRFIFSLINRYVLYGSIYLYVSTN